MTGRDHDTRVDEKPEQLPGGESRAARDRCARGIHVYAYTSQGDFACKTCGAAPREQR